jgi:hypothetical protein
MNQVQEKELTTIIELVSNHTGISTEQIKATGRAYSVVPARQIYCLIAKAYTGYSVKTIGQFINRDHTSILYSLQKIQDLAGVYPLVMEQIQTIWSQLSDSQLMLPIKLGKGSKQNFKRIKKIKVVPMAKVIKMPVIEAYIEPVKEIRPRSNYQSPLEKLEQQYSNI